MPETSSRRKTADGKQQSHGLKTEVISMEETTNTQQTSEQEVQQDIAEPKPSAQEHEADKKPPEKTFTQKELDEIIEKRLKRERASAEEKAGQAQKEISALKTRNICYKLGIKEDCIEDAVTLAERIVNDKTDIEAALSKILEKYPAFGGSAETPKNKTTGVKTETTVETDDTALRKAFGLPSKK